MFGNLLLDTKTGLVRSEESDENENSEECEVSVEMECE